MRVVAAQVETDLADLLVQMLARSGLGGAERCGSDGAAGAERGFVPAEGDVDFNDEEAAENEDVMAEDFYIGTPPDNEGETMYGAAAVRVGAGSMVQSPPLATWRSNEDEYEEASGWPPVCSPCSSTSEVAATTPARALVWADLLGDDSLAVEYPEADQIGGTAGTEDTKQVHEFEQQLANPDVVWVCEHGFGCGLCRGSVADVDGASGCGSGAAVVVQSQADTVAAEVEDTGGTDEMIWFWQWLDSIAIQPTDVAESTWECGQPAEGAGFQRQRRNRRPGRRARAVHLQREKFEAERAELWRQMQEVEEWGKQQLVRIDEASDSWQELWAVAPPSVRSQIRCEGLLQYLTTDVPPRKHEKSSSSSCV